uniref:Uncharacterized protein n=1 Tax=Setaria italica TaxID=4555 RepID=K3Z243_SETIT
MLPPHVQTHALYYSTQMKGLSNEPSSMHIVLTSVPSRLASALSSG